MTGKDSKAFGQSVWASRFWLAMLACLLGEQAMAVGPLPQRTAPAPYTSSHVPHVQVGVEPVPEVDAELLRRVATLPGLSVRPTVISLPGAMGFWLADDMPLSRPEVIVRGREFAHVHPDGSLHASLPPKRAAEAVASAGASGIHGQEHAVGGRAS